MIDILDYKLGIYMYISGEEKKKKRRIFLYLLHYEIWSVIYIS